MALEGHTFWHFPQEMHAASSITMPFFAGREVRLKIVP
jgi:hypothetical protein